MSLVTIGSYAFCAFLVLFFVCDTVSRFREALADGVNPTAASVWVAVTLGVGIAGIAVALLTR